MSETHMELLDQLCESILMNYDFTSRDEVHGFIGDLTNQLLFLVDPDNTTSESEEEEASEDEDGCVKEKVKVKDLGDGHCEIA